jgi:hypothetical protein
MARPKRLGGPEVHGYLKFYRKLHREIVRLHAAQNAIDISGERHGLDAPGLVLKFNVTPRAHIRLQVP